MLLTKEYPDRHLSKWRRTLGRRCERQRHRPTSHAPAPARSGIPRDDPGFFGNRLSLDAVLQRAAFEVLHDNEVPVINFTDVINRADVWVIQRGGCSRLALKSIPS